MTVSTKNTDILTASLGKPIVLAYGRHVVGGNVILKDETDAAQTIVFVALGDAFGGGEWDGIEKLYINGQEVALELPENYQFHKGLPGQLSSNGTLDPEGTGSRWPFAEAGDQKVDALTPPAIQGLTFSRTAYLALRIPFDPFAPGPELSVRGVFHTRKVRIFDASGIETGYQYSDNPAWQIADLLTTIRGLPDSRLDWASFKAAADYCDELIANGQAGGLSPRFVSHVAFAEEVDFDEALEALLATCRGFLTDVAGAIQLRIDQVRTSAFDFTMDNIVESTFKAWRKDTRESPNRLELMFRDLENDLQVMTKLWNHEPQQARTGRVISAKLHLGNLPQQQAERIGNYLLTKAIDNNLFCRFRATPASFAVMPGDVVRVAHDAAPWSQLAAGNNRLETFEVLEVAEHPDETREFLCQLYRDSTYPDTAGPTQNLIGTTVRRRPGAPPKPRLLGAVRFPPGPPVAAIPNPQRRGHRTGDLIVLADPELTRAETTLAATMAADDRSITVAALTGFLVGDTINIGQEILKIVGPGVNEVPPTSNTWQVARAQKLTEAGSAASGAGVYRLEERNLHFALPPGFTLNRAGETHTVDFRPGRLRILYAGLQFTGLGGVSELVEMPFWAEYELNAAIFGTLPGLRVSNGGIVTFQIPGPLTTGTDLAKPITLPEDVSISWIYAQAEQSPFQQSGGVGKIGIQMKLDNENFGPVGLLPGIITGGPTGQLVWMSGAAKGNVGKQTLAVEITQVGTDPDNPGRDLTIFVLY
ncbi:MAG: hypothetical protein HYS38_10180 [Acidobacteria bacterium]|nr:hypothetical protein [Acidobacteriota bacterium]